VTSGLYGTVRRGPDQRCDAAVVVISEERGDVSIAYNAAWPKG
jgi:hypothetical protein